MLSTPRRLTQTDLQATDSPEQAHALFRTLGYRVEGEALPVAVGDLQLGGRDLEAVEGFHVLSSYGDDFLVGLWQLNDLSGARLRSLGQNFLNRGTDCLFLATYSDFNPLVFVSPRRVSAGKTKVFKLVVDRYHPTRHDLDLLEGLRAQGLEVPEILAAHREAFNVDRVTKRFYRAYAGAFRRLQEALQQSNRGVAQFAGKSEEHKAYQHAFAQRLMGRLMFLYFIQKKSWLNGDQRFLTNWFHALPEGGNYYRDVLEPLFFETLNTPESERTTRAKRFGDVPYLNGGLFERDYEFLLHLDNDVFDPDAEEGLLHLFNCYNFTVTEDTPLEVEVALDPEMLGKVFENLLEEDERGRDGTFYTPRVIVHTMCREALAEHLKSETGLEEALVRRLIADPEETQLTVGQARKVEGALGGLRCLDPAVGSGAFLVGMLQEMVSLRHACFRAQGAEVSRAGSLVAEWKREAIQECLYGVDIKREAIEIAKLRLWLSLVVDLERQYIEPLPNLDFKIMDGNSLIETMDGRPILRARPPRSGTDMSAQAMDVALEMSGADTAMGELHALKDRFFAATPGERAGLVEEIREKEAELLESRVGERLRDIELRQKQLVERKALGKGRLRKADETTLQALASEGGRLGQLIQDVRKGASLPFFLYGLHFCEVFGEKGGFDIVIANPPYVATQAVNQLPYRDELEAQFGYRRDLYVHFVDRILGLTECAVPPLLKPGGVMSLITSSTWFSQEFFRQFRGGGAEPAKRKEGQPWPFRRGLLHCNLLKILDCPPVFDATVNTAVVVLRNEPAKPGQEFTFIGASRLDQVLRRVHNIGGETLDLLVQEKLGALVEGFEGAEEFTADGRRVLRVVRGGIPVYRVPLSLYHDCVFQGVFEPSPALVAFYDKYMRSWVATVEREFEVGEGGKLALWEMVRRSDNAAEAVDHLDAYRGELRSGDATILGAVTTSGVGLQTGDNGRFLAYLDGTPEALNLLSRNDGMEPDDTGAYPNSDWGQGGVRRIIARDQIASEGYLTTQYQRHGIPEAVAHWVPYEKGDAEGNRWTRTNNCYVDWSETAVRRLLEKSNRPPNKSAFQNPHLYFLRGFCWNVRLTDFLKARAINSCIPGHKAMFVTTVLPTMPNSAMLACLNSRLLSTVIRQFTRSPQSFEMNDARAVPLVIPAPELADRLEQAVSAATSVQEQRLAIWTRAELADEDLEGDPEYRRLGEELAGIEAGIDGLIAELYGLPVPEDPVEELVRLAAAEGE